MTPEAPAVSGALHADERLVVESGGTLVRAAHRTPTAPRRLPSVHALKADIRHYITDTNQHPTPFHWTKTADEILASVARFCRRTSETGH